MTLSSLVVAGRLTLQSAANSSASGAEAITLSGEVAATQGDSDTFSIALLTADHDAVKLADAVGTGSANTTLSFVGTLITDQGGVSVTPATADDVQVAASFVVDGTAPLLVDFDFDLTAGGLSLAFSEVLRKSTLNTGLLTLQDSTTSATSSVPLTGSTVIGSNGPNLTVAVTKLQLDAIKASRTLCVTNTNCVVALSTAAIKDMAANPVVSVAVTATEFTPDTAAPELITFNYTSGCVGVMILEFSETMNRSSLEIVGITLQDNSTATVSHTLTKFSSTDVDGTTFTLALSSTDTDVLKRSIICATWGNCFVSIPGVAMADCRISRWLRSGLVAPSKRRR